MSSQKTKDIIDGLQKANSSTEMVWTSPTESDQPKFQPRSEPSSSTTTTKLKAKSMGFLIPKSATKMLNLFSNAIVGEPLFIYDDNSKLETAKWKATTLLSFFQQYLEKNDREDQLKYLSDDEMDENSQNSPIDEGSPHHLAKKLQDFSFGSTDESWIYIRHSTKKVLNSCMKDSYNDPFSGRWILDKILISTQKDMEKDNQLVSHLCNVKRYYVNSKGEKVPVMIPSSTFSEKRCQYTRRIVKVSIQYLQRMIKRNEFYLPVENE